MLLQRLKPVCTLLNDHDKKMPTDVHFLFQTCIKFPPSLTRDPQT